MSGPSKQPTVVLASRNRKKVAEMVDLLQPHGIAVASVADFPDVPEVVEDGSTFAENAAKKACQTAQHLSQWTIGEDSGLIVDALDGAPGVYSARYSGPGADDEANNRKLMQELAGVSEERRTAHYECHVAVADPSGTLRLEVAGACRGRMTTEACGANGFGYDPYFLIPEYHQTFGELAPVVKRHISHRARAFERFVPQLVGLLEEGGGWRVES